MVPNFLCSRGHTTHLLLCAIKVRQFTGTTVRATDRLGEGERVEEGGNLVL